MTAVAGCGSTHETTRADWATKVNAACRDARAAEAKLPTPPPAVRRSVANPDVQPETLRAFGRYLERLYDTNHRYVERALAVPAPKGDQEVARWRAIDRTVDGLFKAQVDAAVRGDAAAWRKSLFNRTDIARYDALARRLKIPRCASGVGR